MKIHLSVKRGILCGANRNRWKSSIIQSTKSRVKVSCKRCLALMPIKPKALIDAELKRQIIEMWGMTYKFTPALVAETLGDGKQFIKFFPMNYRPLFYLIRVDSKWDEDNFGENPICDHTDEIWEAIEDEFGVCCEMRGDCECDGYELYPTTSDTSGSVWATLSERDVKKLHAQSSPR